MKAKIEKPVITLKDVTYQVYGTKSAAKETDNEHAILSHINLEFHPGNFYGVLGPNGAGKTTLMRCVLGFIKPTAGEILVQGNDLAHIARKDLAKKIAFLPQSFTSGIDFTVYDIVAMGREPYRKPLQGLTKEDDKLIMEALELVNCQHLMHRRMTYLSGGERQRVMIARTIAQDTEWIVLDEPVSNLDIKHQYDLMKVFERLYKEKGKSVIAILHDLNLARQYCNQIVLLKNGTVMAQGETKNALSLECLEQVYDIPFEMIKGNQGNQTFMIPKV